LFLGGTLLSVGSLIRAQSPPQASPSGTGTNKPFLKGTAALRRGDLIAAQASFETAVRLNPDDIQARNALGLVVLAQNDATAAATQFKAALRIRPSFLDARVNLCSA